MRRISPKPGARGVTWFATFSTLSLALSSSAHAMAGPAVPSSTTVKVEYCSDREQDGFFDTGECVLFDVESPGPNELFDLERMTKFIRRDLALIDNCPQDYNDQGDADGDGVGDVCEYVTVTAGANHSCALRQNGSAHCWGNNDFGQADAPTWRFTAIAAGENHTCGLIAADNASNAGRVVCWGDNRFNQLGAAEGAFTRMHVDGDVSCAIKQDGRAACWGACGADYECSLPEKVIDVAPMFDITTPGAEERVTGLCMAAGETQPLGSIRCNGDVPTPEGGYFALDGDERHACGLKFGGAIACFGIDEHDPVLTPPAGSFSFLSVGPEHACAVGFDRTVKCWGDNAFGRANAPTGKFEAIAVGDTHSCAVAQSGKISCWGEHGVPPNTDTSPNGIFFGHERGSLANKLLPRLTTYRELAAGGPISCGITERGKMSCSSLARPGFFNPEGKFNEVRVGEAGVCAERADGMTLCWDEHGNVEELAGVEKVVTRLYSMVVNNNFVDREYLCGIYKSSKKLFCRDDGQPTPAEPDFQFGPKFKDIGVMGQRTVCGITQDNRFLCQDYRAGTEVEVKPGHTFEHLSCSFGTCCASNDKNTFCRGPDGEVTRLYPQSSIVGPSTFGSETTYTLDDDGCYLVKKLWPQSDERKCIPARDIRDFDLGPSHHCTLDERTKIPTCIAADGDTSGVQNAPSFASYELTAGNRFSCALDERDFTATCWGQVRDEATRARRDYRGKVLTRSFTPIANTTVTANVLSP